MTDAAYIGLDEIEPADLATCGDGLFQSLRPDIFGNVLVTTFGKERYVVYLEDPEGPRFVPAPAGESSTRLGILWSKPEIEVDTTTFFNPDREDERLGDLIFATQPMIYAREPEGWFNDGQRTPLWGRQAATGKPVGFRSWRLVSVTGDRRRVIFEQKPRPVTD